jgi:predicted nucleotide-binding protein
MAHYTEEHLRVEKLIDPIADFLTSLKRVTTLSAEVEIDQTKFAGIGKSCQKLVGKLNESKYSHNVFIMMSYKDDDRYRKTIQTIKRTLKDNGFNGLLASDKTVNSQLWGNVQAYMLACKYGIAIITREEERKGTKTKITTSQYNPNVAIELGFMLSRGKDVLILKDKVLEKIPTDVMGSLYQDFDLDNPRRSLARTVKRWIKEILSKETE